MVIDYKPIVVAFGFILFDIVSGVIGALVRGDFESKKMREGGKHKLFLLIVLSFGVFLDLAQSYVELGINLPCNTTICGYIAIMEILSIVENIKITFPDALPKAITDMLKLSASNVGIKDEQE